jgi:hypothetical protein
MTNTATACLNNLPASHWDAWYAHQREWNALLTKYASLGVIAAADADCRELVVKAAR